MAKTTKSQTATEQKIEEFAEDLGHLLGSATKKAENWLSQRQQIVKRLTEVRDTASKLLTDLGHQAESAVATGKRAYKRRGRPAAKAVVAATTKVKRTMSAKARKAISMAQKARWAKQKAGDKKQ
jgi:hypothetical protein